MSAFAPQSARVMAAAALAFSLGGPFLLAVTAAAQERHDRDHHDERDRTPHWVYDDRYHHGHYYPSHGYVVRALPPGYVSLSFRNGRFFFHGGVWYQASGPGFVVIQPPLGIVVAALPPAYTMITVRGVPYYYANSVYYTPVRGGYAVAEPPPDATASAVQPAPPAPPPAQAGPPAGSSAPAPTGTWYYCESARAYYPYVAECREGWRPVPAAPPPAPPAR